MRADPRSRDEPAFETPKYTSNQTVARKWFQVTATIFGLLGALLAAYSLYSGKSASSDGYVSKLEAQYSAAQQEIAQLKTDLAVAKKATDDAERAAQDAERRGFDRGAASRDSEVKNLKAQLLKLPAQAASKPRGDGKQ